MSDFCTVSYRNMTWSNLSMAIPSNTKRTYQAVIVLFYALSTETNLHQYDTVKTSTNLDVLQLVPKEFQHNIWDS